MKLGNVWKTAVIVLLLTGVAVTVSADTRQSSADLDGWSIGLAMDTVRGRTIIGPRLGYWYGVLGFDVRAQLVFEGLEDTDSGDSYDEVVNLAASLGGKIGFRTGPAQWYGRAGVRAQIEDRVDIYTEMIGAGELGIGVDLAASDRLIIGLQLLDLRFFTGTYNEPEIDEVGIVGGRVGLFSGGHVSYRF